MSSVLVVVDVQNGFVRAGSAHIVPVIANLVKQWQDANGDVLFTRYFNYPGSPFERLIHWTGLQESPDTDIVPGLRRYTARGTVLDKHTYTLFSDEGSALVLSRGWTDIYVCGIATESCVLKTAVDAFERDLTPWLIQDASASHAGQAAHDAGVLITERFIGRDQIITVADALAAITATHITSVGGPAPSPTRSDGSPALKRL